MEKTPSKRAVLSNDAFLAELQSALASAAQKGTALVTMKRHAAGEDSVCLVRVRYQDHKSTTLVRSKDLVRFQTKLSAVLKQTWGNALPKKPSKRAARAAGGAAAAAAEGREAAKRAKE